MNRATSQLKIMHFNIHSIKHRKDELGHFLAINQIDIVSLNETWLKPKDKLSIPKYKIIRKDRRDQQGGGVCILVHQDIDFERINLAHDVEAVSITVKNSMKNNRDLHITSYYSPPDQLVNKELIKQVLSYEYSILLGDLNAHSLRFSGHDANSSGLIVCDLLLEEEIIILNDDSPTFLPSHPANHESTLDLALAHTRLGPMVSNFNVIRDDIRSDHLPFILEIDSTLPPRLATREQVVRKIDWPLFQVECTIRAPKIASLNSLEEIDNSIEQVTTAIQQSLAVATSEKKVRINTNRPLLLPRYILELIREKRAAARTYQKKRTPESKTEFNRLTAKVTFETKKFKQNKWEEFCTSLNGMPSNSSTIWKAIKSTDTSVQPKYRTSRLQDNNGKLWQEPTKIASIFADHLEKVFMNEDDPSFNQNNFNRINQCEENWFLNNTENIIPTTKEEVAATIKSKIGSKGAPGEDGISNRALKELPPEYHQQLANIFNASMRFNYIPAKWKTAEVVLIPKPNKDHTRPENHRPISLLNTLSKLLERVIMTRVQKWLQETNLISNFQCGFRSARQTNDQLFRLINDGRTAFNKREKLGALFIDIEKAFDKVWHNGLLFKLDRASIPNYLGKWIQNYLSQRTFRVRANGSHSTHRAIETGVPQGSVLGPTLFLIFFNDIIKENPSLHEPRIALFADDKAAWVASRSLKTIKDKLQKQLDHVSEWMSNWRSKISTNKTTISIFNMAGKFIQNVRLKYNGQDILPEKHPKFLGVTLDPSLCFNQHFKIMESRCYRLLNCLRSIKGRKWGASEKVIIRSYKVLIRPVIEYAPFIPLIAAPTHQHTLETIQNAAIRIASYWPLFTPTETMLHKAKLESVESRAFQLSNKYIIKAYSNNQLIKEYIDDYNIAINLNEGSHYKPNSTPHLTIIKAIRDHRLAQQCN